MLRAVVVRRQVLAVSAVLAAALGCWVVAYRSSSTMGGLGPFVAAWVTSTAAMMLPTAAPMVVAYSGIRAERTSVPAFVIGYLAVWTAFGLVAYSVGLELAGWIWLGGAGLVLAGLYQLTPLKDVCLRR